MENMEKKNTVSSQNQVCKSILFEGAANGSPRVMFLGNSITLHGPKADIGWYGNWGMAASKKENDYVHLCMKHIQKKYENAAFCITNAAAWEREYRECEIETVFCNAKEFAPDLIITRLSENVPVDYLDKDSFVEKMHEFHRFLSKEDTKLIVTSNVFNNKLKDEALEAYAEKYNVLYVYLDDYMDDKENLASEYAHEGVRIHPGDKGMKFIADRIIEAIDKVI